MRDAPFARKVGEIGPSTAPVRIPAETPDEAFRREMRQFMRDTRDALKDLKTTVDTLLATKELDDD